MTLHCDGNLVSNVVVKDRLAVESSMGIYNGNYNDPIAER
jgi:hypothetical protein